MAYMNCFSQPDEGRRDELIRIIEHSVEKLTFSSSRNVCRTSTVLIIECHPSLVGWSLSFSYIGSLIL